MPEPDAPLVSIVLPTYNEERDIARTLDALAAQTYRPIEVIAVDASRDRTPAIIQSYADRLPGLRVIPQGSKRGVSVARNIGLHAASGEIVVILNADVFPDPDFIERIVPHYRAGADYLLVESRIVNTERLFPRYLQAQHAYGRRQPDHADWTEGYSCRLRCALEAGGFPEEFGRNTAGEDGVFAERMRAAGCRRAEDYSIVVPHVAPDTYRDYWSQRLGRGRGGAFLLYAYRRRPIRWAAILRSVLGTWFLALTLIAPLLYTWRLLPYTPRGLRDWLPFTWARVIEMLATGAGYWDGAREIARERAASQP
ncbi:MAG: hypothetical protein Kow00124_13450 [Anaerolineae bacterium]